MRPIVDGKCFPNTILSDHNYTNTISSNDQCSPFTMQVRHGSPHLASPARLSHLTTALHVDTRAWCLEMLYRVSVDPHEILRIILRNSLEMICHSLPLPTPGHETRAETKPHAIYQLQYSDYSVVLVA